MTNQQPSSAECLLNNVTMMSNTDGGCNVGKGSEREGGGYCTEHTETGANRRSDEQIFSTEINTKQQTSCVRARCGDNQRARFICSHELAGQAGISSTHPPSTLQTSATQTAFCAALSPARSLNHRLAGLTVPPVRGEKAAEGSVRKSPTNASFPTSHHTYST